MKVDKIKEYSPDYKLRNMHGVFYCTVEIDFDFAMSLPDMENRVYYKKSDKCTARERLNAHGVKLIFKYDLFTEEIKSISVVFNYLCQIEYTDRLEEIVSMLLAYKTKLVT